MKDQIVEVIKYDHNNLKLPWVIGAKLYILFLQLLGNHEKAFSISSQVFRTGWAGSYQCGLKQANYYFKKKPSLGARIAEDATDNIDMTDNIKKFISNPILMLDGVITVLKNPHGDEKGVLIINYSVYFTLFLKFYDVRKISSKFYIILEPSWAGLCEINILAYTLLDSPVFLQVYEDRDKAFIKSLNTNIIPVEVGPSWFINYKNFDAPERGAEKDIDIIMVAAWASFKRHRAFFKAVKPLLKSLPNLNITLVGYPVDMLQSDIVELAEKYGLLDNITIYEWITPEDVAALQRRAKVNVLWSKFEGNNRAIIEGMYCDSPVILREGHNYGQHYDFINRETGKFANESNLSTAILDLFESELELTPRNYVMKNRNCIAATEKMNEAIKCYEKSIARDWQGILAVKTNELHGMNYFDRRNTDFTESYEWLENQLLKDKS